MPLAKRVSIILLVLGIVSALLFTVYALGPKPAACLELQPAPPSTLTFSVQEESLKAVQQVVAQNPAATLYWERGISLFPPDGDTSGWVFVAVATPRAQVPALAEALVPIPLPADTETTFYVMVRNAWFKPHAMRLIFLLDYQQVQIVSAGGEVKSYYDLPMLQPQADGAVALRLPKLTRGFHQLSVLLIADPDNYTEDIEYRFYQQKSFIEIRHELWVGVDARPTEVPAFESFALAQAADTRTVGAELVLDALKKTNEPLLTLNLKPGAETCVNLRLFNTYTAFNAPYTGPVPLHIVAFWDDHLTHTFDYQLSTADPEHLTLQFKIQAPPQAGRYQFSMAIFKFPGYSQFSTDRLEYAIYSVSDFSRRVVVEVVP